MALNDLPNISDVLKFYLFADDTNIYYEDKSLKTIDCYQQGTKEITLMVDCK